MKKSILLILAALVAFPGAARSFTRAEQVCEVQRESGRRHRGYVKDDRAVWYGGRRVEGAVPSSFTDLGRGYGKDNWKVFYAGREVKGAAVSSFAVLGGGYAKDNWTVFYCGRKVEGAAVSSFENLGSGYFLKR